MPPEQTTDALSRLRKAAGKTGSRSDSPSAPNDRILRIDNIPHPIESVGILGAGIMGQSIALVNVEHNIPVTITDLCGETLSTGIENILAEIPTCDDHASSQTASGAQLPPLIVGVPSNDHLAGTDLVIEAIVEKMAVKKRVLARLEPALRDDTIIASNTSSIPISKIAVALVHPERFCGLHFCHPLRNRALVEVIPGDKTSPQTVRRVLKYAEAIGKKPIVVADSPGFVVNRLLLPYLNESVELLLEGVAVESIETAAQTFGMPIGPLSQLDAIGIDVALRAGTTLLAAFSDRVVSSDVMIGLFEVGQLGRKSGAGFFCYENERPSTTLSPKAEELVAERRRPAATIAQEQIIHRLFLPMLLEATRVLEENLVDGASEVDTAVIDGIAFPASKGGVFGWADALGAANVVEMLNLYKHLGKRYHATEILLRSAGNNLRFYE